YSSFSPGATSVRAAAEHSPEPAEAEAGAWTAGWQPVTAASRPAPIRADSRVVMFFMGAEGLAGRWRRGLPDDEHALHPDLEVTGERAEKRIAAGLAGRAEDDRV